MAIGIVQTRFGKVSGLECTEPKYAGITRFKGVRYGGDMGGENRWKPPVDPTPWEGVMVCDGSAVQRAMQPDLGALQDEPYKSDFYFVPDPPIGEDCLFLDITTGAQEPGEKRPVFMWFHGGGVRRPGVGQKGNRGCVGCPAAQRIRLSGSAAALERAGRHFR